MKNTYQKILIVTSIAFLFAVISGCSSSGRENIPEIKNTGVSLPPSSVGITGEILSVEEHDKLFSVSVIIKKVNRYGAGTPLLSTNDNLPVRINKTLLKNKDRQEYKIKPGETFKLLLKQISSVGQIQGYWEALEIIK